MKEKTILVTGGAGFIGSNLVDLLIDEKFNVIIIDNLSSGKIENINRFASFYDLDLANYKNFEKIKNLVKKCSYVFHLAANPKVQPSIDYPLQFNKNNVDSTLMLLSICKDLKNVKKFIYSGSSSVYGNSIFSPTEENSEINPLSPYALQKLIGEQYCKIFSYCYNLKTVNLRYFNVFGERQSFDGAYSSVIGIFLHQKNKGKPLTITGDGNQRRDFVYVKDVARANLLAMMSNKVENAEIINIGYGKNYSINEIADIIGGEKIYIQKRIEPNISLANIERAKILLGWEPKVSIQDWVQTLI